MPEPSDDGEDDTPGRRFAPLILLLYTLLQVAVLFVTVELKGITAPASCP